MRNGSTIPDETGIHRNGYTNHPRIPKPNLPFIATLVLYLSMTLFQKAPPQSHTTTDLQPDLPHVPPTQNQTTPVSPNNRLSLARISITHSTSNSPPPDPQHHPY